MALKPLRRLNIQTGESLFDRLASGVLTYAGSRDEMDETERSHPNLIVEKDGNLLTLHRVGSWRLAYSFRNEAAFVDSFPAMFEELLPRLRREQGAETVEFRITYGPARTVVEPVLKRLSFTPRTPWLGFSLARTRLPKLPATPGVTYRLGADADFDDVMRLDRECFPDHPMPSDVLRGIVTQQQLLLAVAGKQVAGMAIHSLESAQGYLTILAVSEAFRGRAIGASLTLRVAKSLFAEGAPRVDLKTDEDNGGAIRLYRSLGFDQVGAGRDYSRPTDERVIKAMQKAGEGTLIRFGGWR